MPFFYFYRNVCLTTLGYLKEGCLTHHATIDLEVRAAAVVIFAHRVTLARLL